MPPHRHSHLLAAVFLVDQQQVQDQVLAVQRIHTRVAVEQLPELYDAAALPREVVYVVHDFCDDVVQRLARRRLHFALRVRLLSRVQAPRDEVPSLQVLAGPELRLVQLGPCPEHLVVAQEARVLRVVRGENLELGVLKLHFRVELIVVVKAATFRRRRRRGRQNRLHLSDVAVQRERLLAQLLRVQALHVAVQAIHQRSPLHRV